MIIVNFLSNTTCISIHLNSITKNNIENYYGKTSANSIKFVPLTIEIYGSSDTTARCSPLPLYDRLLISEPKLDSYSNELELIVKSVSVFDDDLLVKLKSHLTV